MLTLSLVLYIQLTVDVLSTYQRPLNTLLLDVVTVYPLVVLIVYNTSYARYNIVDDRV